MIRVFIIYGGSEGESIGRKLEIYFKSNGIKSFLASPTSPEILPSEKFEERIDYELKNANFVIIVVTESINSSEPAKNEIHRVLNELKYPYIPFVKEDSTIPSNLQDRWNVSFSDGNIDEKMIEIELKMWRYYDRIPTLETSVKSENDEITAKKYTGFK
ncbi:TIR domain protein [Marine Group I thaumarchaeote SCGC AAA799-B03]|uniref:TIR domain protein n=1 Tax=Marine Group I thaumarchaeote SCGC AAA799-B03 TaxID=1502289 RepID=A0A087S6Y3_9ARCH|nr:TIR domain protein [Marine Group I thaumarchaeote SCGC AAA799-B03]